MRKRRVVCIVLDSVGAGALPDAAAYGDAGAATLRHIAERTGVCLPTLTALGLGNIPGTGFPPADAPRARFGRAMERSAGKDTTTGHWEMAGVPLDAPFPTFPDGFPPELMNAFERAIGRGTLGNCAASGTEIIARLGDAHVATGKPIVYTSADSVFQIAAHEEIVPLAELYVLCETARALCQGPFGVGRVIARPFVGKDGQFTRTAGRRDFALPPPSDTMLDILKRAGKDVIGVGKIEDIFAHRGLTESEHASGNAACMATTMRFFRRGFDGLMFVNLVDFDMLYGHRRDVTGYAAALAAFDAWLPSLMAEMRPEDLLIVTADHGCDPTHAGTDHTREYIPILAYGGASERGRDIGTRDTFADIAATVLAAFDLPPVLPGKTLIEGAE